MRIRRLLIGSPLLVTLVVGCSEQPTMQPQVLPPGMTKAEAGKAVKKGKLKAGPDIDAVSPGP